MKTRKSLLRGISWLGGASLLACLIGGVIIVRPEAVWSSDGPEIPEDVRTAAVRRTNLEVLVTASGELNSAENTLIECELEDYSERTAGGQRISTSGRSMIIQLIPEGSVVQKGDVLCQIDGSEFEEMIRQKRIENEQARSELQQSELDLQTARIALTEYLEGTRIQRYQDYEGQIALAEAQYQRQKDRVDWAERMRSLGYISSARFEQEKQLLLQNTIELQKVRAAFESYKKYTEPKEIQTLETKISQHLSTVAYMKHRLERKEERLAEYEEQLKNCTVRAPHDGYVIYAEDDDDPPLQVGVEVHEHMDLFMLPDLNQMQVEAKLNETVVRNVEEGMPVRVRVVAFPDQVLEGRVEKVESLPHRHRYSWAKDDVKQYMAIIKIDSAPGLMPKMDAKVEILTEQRPDALVIPAEAVVVENGLEYCYVQGPDGLERRPVEVAPGTIDMLEVSAGLSEGDRVVLHPSRLDLEKLVVDRPQPEPVDNAMEVAGQPTSGSPLLQ